MKLSDKNKPYKFLEENYIALDMAIEALQQQPCEIHLTCTDEDRTLSSAQIDLTHIVFETLAECGIYGEEATIKFIGTLKRLGRSDLLPPCVR